MCLSKERQGHLQNKSIRHALELVFNCLIINSVKVKITDKWHSHAFSFSKGMI